MIPNQRPYGYNQPQIPGPMGPNPMPNLPNPNQPQAFIDLSVEQRPILASLAKSKERVLYAGEVMKLNKYNTAQKRILVITDKFLYNIEPSSSFLCSSGSFDIKRKIPMAQIFGATISVNPTTKDEQFIVNVNKDYDYRYNGNQRREKIIKALMTAHFLIKKDPFLIYCRDEADLFNFHTTDDDLAAKRNRRPTQGKIYVTAEMVQNGLGWIIFNRKELAHKSSLLPTGPISNPTQPMPYNPNQFPGNQAPNNFQGPSNGAPKIVPGPGYGTPNNTTGPYNGPSPVNPNPNQGYGAPNKPPVFYVPNGQPNQPGTQGPVNQVGGPQLQQNNAGNQVNTQNYGYGAQPQNNGVNLAQQNQPQGYGLPPVNAQSINNYTVPNAPNQHVQLNFENNSPINKQNGVPNQNGGPQYPVSGGQGNFVPQYQPYGGQGNVRPNY